MTYCCQTGRALESNSICKRKKKKEQKMNYVQQGLEKRVVWMACSLLAPLIALFSLWTETHPPIALLEEVQQ